MLGLFDSKFLCYNISEDLYPVPSRSYRAGLNQHFKCFLAAKEAKGPWQSFPWHCFQVLWASPLCVYRVPGQVSNQAEFYLGLFALGCVGLCWILCSSCRKLIYWNSAAWFQQEQCLWFKKLWVWIKWVFRGLWRLVLCVIAKGCRSGAHCLSVQEA